MNIPGWNWDITPWQKQFAPRIPPGGTYLEVGVFLGASLATMGELRGDIQLIAVDPWIDAPDPPGWCGVSEFADAVKPHGSLFRAFLHYMTSNAPGVLDRTRIIRGTAKTVTLHSSVDMLFIDGDHSEQAVTDDLMAFAPLVKPGGIIAGHDYHVNAPGVIAAVDAYFDMKPNTLESVWWFKV